MNIHRKHSVVIFFQILVAFSALTTSLESKQTFAEDFENGLPTENWEYYGGPMVTSASFVLGGIGRSGLVLRMRSSGSNPTLNEAIYTVDLRDSTVATLQFESVKLFNEIDDLLPPFFPGHENGDGVVLSVDGINWYTIVNAPELGASNVNTINLFHQRNIIRTNYDPDFEFTEHTKIKFQQYDEFVDPNADFWLLSIREWDDIVVTAEYADVLRVIVDDSYLEGTTSITGSIEITNAQPADLTVYLSGEASLSLPEQVVVSAGQTLAEFSFSISDDSETQGQRLGTIKASATNYSSVNREFNIYDDESPYSVTFDLDGKSSLVDGALVQYVPWGQAAIEPKLEAYPGWHFDGWSTEYSRITQDLLVVAQYRPTYDVVFNLGTKGTLYKGELVQVVAEGNTAIPPTLIVEDGWSLVGWDTDYSNVRQSLLVTAQYESEAMTGTLSTKLNVGYWIYQDYFGQSVSLFGNTLLVGAHQGGHCYVFNYENGNWSEVQKLTHKTINTDAQFGFSVDLYGDVAVIGAPADSVEGVASGSVYVYRRNAGTWSLEARLSADEGAAGDRFGESVSIEANTLVVGAARSNASDNDSGCVYVFVLEQNQWRRQAKLVGHDLTANDRFGSSVDICGERIVVGAPRDDANGFYSGSAYVFHRVDTVWTEASKLLGDVGIEYQLFGSSVSISNNLVAIGAPSTFSSSTGLGSVYIFEYKTGGWIKDEQIWGSDSEGDDYFGASVHLSAETLIIGAPLDDFYTDNQDGSIYLFEKDGNNWVEEQRLGATLDEYGEGRRFGTSVALSGSVLAVVDSGVNAFVFDLGVASITVDFDLDGKATRTGGGDLQQTIRVGDAAIAPYLEALEGWHFIGWDLDLTNLKESATVKAQFLPIHNVSFDPGAYGTHVGGGSLIQQIIDGQPALEPVLLVDNGWYFDGWSINFNSVSEDLNISARYLPSHTVSFDLGEHGELISGELVQKVGDGLSAIAPQFSVAPGWSFVGWDVLFHNINAPLVVTAQYHPSESTVNRTVFRETFEVYGQSIGSTIAISGGFAVVGAPHGGSVLTFVRNADGNWSKESELFASDPKSAFFGSSVAISGDTLLVGATGADGHGMVYVFRHRNGSWSEEAKITPKDNRKNGFFPSIEFPFQYSGGKIAIYEDTILLSTNRVDFYVFVRSGNTWTQQAKFTPIIIANVFGSYTPSLSIDGDTVAIGYAGIDKVYIYERTDDSWGSPEEMTPSDVIPITDPFLTRMNLYGLTVSLSGDRLAVGAPGNYGSQVGAVYVYEKTGDVWNERDKLEPENSKVSNFGRLLSLSGDRLAIGYIHNDYFTREALSLYRSDGTSWNEDLVLIDNFDAFSLDGRYLLAGDGERFGSGIVQLVDLGVPAAWVSFDLQDNADRAGGGELSQLVALGEAAIAPELREHSGWVFDGWDSSFDSISHAIEVNALYYDSTSSDNDAMWDGWERRHFGSTDVSDGKIDTDGDGQTDESEFFFGNDPTDPSDYFKITYFSRFSNGNTQLNFTTNDDIVNRRYRILYTDDLSLGKWTPLPLGAFAPSSYGNITFKNFKAPGAAETYFFKVEAFFEE